MHPAGSVIAFTTLTGFGYGLLCWLGGTVLLVYQVPDNIIFISLGMAAVINVIGLSASTWHLGHPERAWRAMSQYRSSWLSREGISAVLSFIPMILLAVATLYEWYLLQKIFALLCVILSLLTVFTTAMIYASLKPVKAWHNPWTIVGYLMHALLCGGVLWWFLNTLIPSEIFVTHTMNSAELLSYVTELDAPYILMFMIIATSFINKLLWLGCLNYGDSSMQSAIGIKGKLRQLDPPHSSANYLMKEMGYQIVRRHALFLRWIAVLATYVLPFIGLLASLGIAGVTAVFISCAIGIVVERYLFFAEAQHTVSLYYQR